MFPEQKGTLCWLQGDVTSITPSGLPRCVALFDVTMTWLFSPGPGCVLGRRTSTAVSRDGSTAALLEIRDGGKAKHSLCPPAASCFFSKPLLSGEADSDVSLVPIMG